jgi:hypothetical protein
MGLAGDIHLTERQLFWNPLSANEKRQGQTNNDNR